MARGGFPARSLGAGVQTGSCSCLKSRGFALWEPGATGSEQQSLCSEIVGLQTVLIFIRVLMNLPTAGSQQAGKCLTIALPKG